MSNFDYTTDSVVDLFTRISPENSETIAPFIPRLFAALADGHTFIYLNKDESNELLHAKPIVGLDSQSPLIVQQNRLFLAKFWQLEKNLAHEINRLSYHRPIPPHANFLVTQLQNWFPNSGSQDQQAAAALTLLQNFMLISGGPGTGKTTTVAKLLALLCQENLPHIALVAPTGKAAARMSEALKNAVENIDGLPENIAKHLRELNGQTVHRLLALKPPEMLPEFDANNRLPIDVLVVDEASMLDIYLLYQLLVALPETCRVILLGDENQLPSVSAGAVLAELVRSSQPLAPNVQQQLQQLLPHRELPTMNERLAKLTISHRFGENSGIGCLARAVVSGDADLAWEQFARFPDELAYHNQEISQIAKQLYHAHRDYWQAIDNQDIAAAFAHQTDVAVLAAHRADVAKLDEEYLRQLHLHNRAVSGSPWFAGQMLMITRNDPATQLYNGDVGIVLPHDNALMAWFPDGANKFRPIALSRLPEHENAFAMTVHKSQGSEYRHVWLLSPLSSENNAFSRTLLYTAITRAKQKFVYCGTRESFQAACTTRDKRRSALSDWLNVKQGELNF